LGAKQLKLQKQAEVLSTSRRTLIFGATGRDVALGFDEFDIVFFYLREFKKPRFRITSRVSLVNFIMRRAMRKKDYSVIDNQLITNCLKDRLKPHQKIEWDQLIELALSFQRWFSRLR